MQTTMKSVIVAKSKAAIEEHNSKNALLIECGMAERWEQCPRFAQREEREERERAIYEAHKAQDADQRSVVARIHREACEKYNLPVDTKEMQYGLSAMYASSRMRWSSGSQVGYTLNIGWNSNCYRANLRFESGTRKVKESSLVKAFEKRAELVVGWIEINRKAKEAAAKAYKALDSSFLERLAKALNASDLKAKMRDDGKIAISKYQFNQYAKGEDRNGRAAVLVPMHQQDWYAYLELLENHKAAVADLIQRNK